MNDTTRKAMAEVDALLSEIHYVVRYNNPSYRHIENNVNRAREKLKVAQAAYAAAQGILDNNYTGAMADVGELVRVALTNPSALQNFIQWNYPALHADYSAAQKAGGFGEWRDIASAPKDGTRILVYGTYQWDEQYESNSKTGIICAEWIIDPSEYDDEGRPLGAWRAVSTNPYVDYVQPSHWMPLPQPPQPNPNQQKE